MCKVFAIRTSTEITKDDTNTGFDTKLGKILNVLREVMGKGKSCAVILLRLIAPKGTMPIVTAKDISEWLVTWNKTTQKIDPKA